MSLVVEVVAGTSRRRLDESEFPIALGGRGEIVPPSGAVEPPLAYLGLAEGELFVQPAGGGVIVNGSAVQASQWLHDGDVVRVGGGAVAVERRDGTVVLRFRAREGAPAAPPSKLPSPPPRASEARATGTTVKPIHFEPVPIEELSRGRRGIGLRGLAFWGALVLLGLAAWALFTSRSVAVEIEPEPDEVAIEGGFPSLRLGDRYLLRPGTYRLVAEKEGYHPLEESIEVGADGEQSFRFSLDALPGRLAIASTPAEGATVSIDGEEIGTTPLPAVELEAGEHELRIRKERHRDFTATVTVEGAGAEQVLTAVLEPLWAPITFTSEPGGARVAVDGRTLGTTPLTADLLEGSHAYEIALPGRKPHRGRVRVVAGEARTVSPSSPLELADGTLELRSTPAEAAVTVNGVYQGTTPLALAVAPGEPQRIELAREGYETKTVELRVPSGETERVSVDLEARLGEVQIAAEPPDAELFVNGEAKGRAQQVLQLPAVSQQIAIRKEGYKEFTTDITPRPGFPQTVEVVLESLVAEKAPLEEVIRTSAGQTLRLVEPRAFQMGAPRREPGRRANEALRDVEITRPFYLGTTEVTNRQFRAFEAGHRSGAVSGHNLEIDHHPVVNVTWEDAARYCNWLSAQDSLEPAYVLQGGELVLASPPTNGYRLPTEAEWALAARYASGEPKKYPWGDELPVAPGSGNFADLTASSLVATTVPDYNDTFPVTAPVDSFAPNALGIKNLGGNVAEWTHDLYAINPSKPGEAVARDPLGAEAGEFHVIRGSSYLHGSVAQLRLTFRDYGNKARPDVGFRIARWAE